MHIEFTKSVMAEDYVEALQAHLRRRKMLSYCLFGICAVACYGCDLYFPSKVAVAVLVSLLVLWEVVFPLIVYPRQYWQSKLLKGEYEVLANDEGMTVVGTDVQSKITWNAYRKYTQTPHLILLYVASNQFVITPKRCLTLSQREEFERFLHDRFG